MNTYVEVLDWHVADLQAAASLVPLPAAGQYVGSSGDNISHYKIFRLLVVCRCLQ